MHIDLKNRINCIDLLNLGHIIIAAIYTKSGLLQVSTINLQILFDEMLAMEKTGQAYKEEKKF